MPTTIQPQSWGVRGASVALSAPDASGVTIPNNGPESVLVARNTGAAGLRVRIAAAHYCSHGRNTHYLEETIPNDSARWTIPLGIGLARARFGTPVQVTFPDGVTGLTVAAATLGDHRGVGADAETPPALGGSPGTVPITDNNATEPDMAAAVADGMVFAANDGHSPVWMKNSGPASRTIYLNATHLCSHGFRDDEIITLAPGELWITKDLPIGRFGTQVRISYDAATGLEFGAIRQGAYAG